ncbi:MULTISPECIES: 50S ribosomal protein L17 [Fervidobacterium]|uniref:Large ribosomal subunit protein bL17 n=1 Tax=Fervidobacterium nodosum (strain ATCC 35602 / DSM 5306 / Rt17-B1) TaxID=381764 RepID=RL17_FERNB|nr:MULTISPECIES: 50S ribosomal protein L17 [Fervidobacterium]A7HM23.1 RecName: Full=Large ribosomal subunit protein bL17; AltName: Full=50S ribosomal protein L17 [Fervidobacterium nodosum Rt17-B1]ABS60956.1 ribosomal protein L17 [Fervidobacterium nodosum Rt17-B1]KAF2962284.1 50S ribosomal protein L17 [Fervidobacterium sp. 2310opik-2]PHJ14436.1 50S ribosomal protein L17 [Fervidobacterium sp. SC_NGM5_G05]
MRHRMKRNKLNRYGSHRRSLMRNLAKEIIEHGTIMTTTVKAKVGKEYIEKLITKAVKAYKIKDENKEESIALRRQLFAELGDRKLVNKLVDEIAPKYTGRNGGYTRVIKVGQRRGDGAEVSVLQIVE